MKVVVLAGGKGTRLGLNGIPKPMVSVDGVPLLERILEVAKASGFKEFIFLNGYLSEVIESHFGDGARFGVHIDHLNEPEPMGTAGAVRLARHLLTGPFIVLYGDILIDIDLQHFAEFALERGGAGSLFVHPNDHPNDSDLLEVDESGSIVQFFPKPHAPGARLPNLVSAALYLLFPDVIDAIPADRPSDWGRDIFANIIKTQRLFAYRSVEYAKDIGTPERLRKAEKQLRDGHVDRLSRRQLKPAIFVDRDGVLNEEKNGILVAEQMSLLPGVAEAIKSVNAAGVPIICVTNQPFIAKGLMTWQALRSVHAEMDWQLAEAGAYLDDVFICPHHPEKGWSGEVEALKIVCDCRKPRPGLLKQAADFHRLDLRRSWLIGDRYSDIAAAGSVGVHSILVETGFNGGDRDKFSVEPDAIAPDLPAAVKSILGDIC